MDVKFGIYGPKRLPADVVTRLNAEFNKANEVAWMCATAMAMPQRRTRSAARRAVLAAMVKKDSARWG